LLAKQRGLRLNVKDILDAMIDKGTRISAKLYQQALLIAEE
jgi:predicted nucleic acid-binding protein